MYFVPFVYNVNNVYIVSLHLFGYSGGIFTLFLMRNILLNSPGQCKFLTQGMSRVKNTDKGGQIFADPLDVQVQIK